MTLFFFLLAAQAGNPRVSGTPPPVTLSAEDRARVAGGEPVYFTTAAEAVPRPGIAFRVDQTQDCIWAVINELDQYADFVPAVKESGIYRQSDGEVCVRFRASHWLAGRYTYHTCHHFPWPKESWGSFELDPEQDNDFTAASGFWRTEPLAADQSQSLVYYVADLQASRGLARLFRRQFVREGLTIATQWLPAATRSAQIPACERPDSAPEDRPVPTTSR